MSNNQEPAVICDCGVDVRSKPKRSCESLSHSEIYARTLEEKLELRDEVRDKLDVAEWLEKYERTKSYTCHSCRRNYEIPTHLTTFICSCGHRCRLRHMGGTDPDAAVIDAARQYFGNERAAQLAWIAEVVGGKHCESYTADDIRKMIREEMNRWTQTDAGWVARDNG